MVPNCCFALVFADIIEEDIFSWKNYFRPKRKIILFPEMHVMGKIFTRVTTGLSFFDHFN